MIFVSIFWLTRYNNKSGLSVLTVFFSLPFLTIRLVLCNRLQSLPLPQLIHYQTLPLCWTSNDQLAPRGALKFLHFSSRLALLWSTAQHAGRGDICPSEDKGQTGCWSVCQALGLDLWRHCSLLFVEQHMDLMYTPQHCRCRGGQKDRGDAG